MWPVMDFVALMGSVDARALNTVLMAIVSAASPARVGTVKDQMARSSYQKCDPH
jgi:hypothetical protein